MATLVFVGPIILAPNAPANVMSGEPGSHSSTLRTLETVFGTLGTVLWCIQLIPQVVLNYRRKTTQGLSVWLYVGWLLSGLCYGPYAIYQAINIPIIVQPQCYGSLCAIVFIQMLYYDRNWTPLEGVSAFAFYAVVGAGWEVGIWYAMRTAGDRGVAGIPMLFGILSTFFLTGGFFPQIYQIWRDREVVGISYLFLAIDSLGAVCSIMSLGFKQQLDGIALAGYIGVFVVEVIVMLSALYLNPRAEDRRLEREGKDGAVRPGAQLGTPQPPA